MEVHNIMYNDVVVKYRLLKPMIIDGIPTYFCIIAIDNSIF